MKTFMLFNNLNKKTVLKKKEIKFSHKYNLERLRGFKWMKQL